jgi:protein RecA
MNKPPEISDEKQKALEAARLQIEKQFGKGSIMKLGEGTGPAAIPVIPTGSILLDAALGVGGYPRGRVMEIFGPESSGKTTLALHAIAEAQKLGGTASFIDAEHALDPLYAKNLGVNTDELWVSQPDNGEQALEIVESLIRSGAMDIIVVDSVAALTPRAEIEGDMGDSHMGLQARLMSQALRKLTGIISKSRTCLVFINQIRMKIGVMFGNPETTTGGNALKFYASVRLEVRKIETISEGTRTPSAPRCGEGGQEQGRPTFQARRAGDYFREGHFLLRQPAGRRAAAEHDRQERQLVFLRGGAHRAGPGEREAVPGKQPRHLPEAGPEPAQDPFRLP